MAERLFVIAEVFTIRGRGVVVAGRWVNPTTRPIIGVGDSILIGRADGTQLRTTVGGIESSTTPPSPWDWVGLLLGPEVRRDAVALGDEVVRLDRIGDLG